MNIQRQSLKSKIILGASLILFVIFTWQGLAQYNAMNQLVIAEEKSYAQAIAVSVYANIENLESGTELAVATVANNPQVQELFYKRNREGLTKLLLPVFDKVKKSVKQFQFHLPDSTSFLRLHKPEKYGDSLKDFRFTVNLANESKKTVIGIEKGVAGYGMRVVMPVKYMDKHVGTVEFGSDFGEGFLTTIKEKYGDDYLMYAITDNTPTLISSTLSTEIEGLQQFSNQDIASLLSAEGVLYRTADERYLIDLIPLYDFSEKTVGFIQVVKDRSKTIAYERNTLIKTALVSVVQFFVVIGLLYAIIHHSLKHIKPLIESIKVFSNGDFSRDIDIKSKDEVGIIGNHLNQMAASLRQLITNTSNSVTIVDDSSQTATNTMREVSSATQEVAKTIEAIAEGSALQMNEVNSAVHTTRQLSDKIEYVQAQSLTIKQNIVDVNQRTDDGVEALNKLKCGLSDESASIHNVIEQISNLSEMSRAINTIVETIDSIANQTNLLSLNAAIEAARAGEHGRGFAVVADEIRQLAMQSSTATDEVRHIIVDIQNAINSANTDVKDAREHRLIADQSMNGVDDAYQTIRGAVSSAIESVHQSEALLSDMIRDKTAVLSAIETISSSVEASSTATEQVSASTEQVSASIQEITGVMDAFKGITQKLKDTVEVFRL